MIIHNINTTKDKLKAQIIDLQELLINLEIVLSNTSKNGNDLRILSAEFHDLRSVEIKNTIPPEATKIQRNDLRNRILKFIDMLQSEDFKDLNTIEIAVISPDAPTQQEMEIYFGKFEKQWSIKCLAFENWKDSGYDILIFDNRLIPDIKDETAESSELRNLDLNLQNQFALMKKTAEDSAKYILHFGNINYLVNQHRDKIYAANSKVALYHRLNELVEYATITKDYLTKS